MRGPRSTFTGCPGFETELPWDLLHDITLWELLVYYPDHVFRWPGLALLYRFATLNTSSTYNYNRLPADIENVRVDNVDTPTTESMRLWSTQAVKQILPDFTDEPGALLNSLRQFVGEEHAMTWKDFLQKHLWDYPTYLVDRLEPAVPLAHVGRYVKTHPGGAFAERVESSMRGWAPERPVAPRPGQFHPILDDLETKMVARDPYLEVGDARIMEGAQLNRGAYPTEISPRKILKHHFEDMKDEILFWVLRIYSAEDLWTRALKYPWRIKLYGGVNPTKEDRECFVKMIKTRKALAMKGRAARRGQDQKTVLREFREEEMAEFEAGRRKFKPQAHRKGKIDNISETSSSSEDDDPRPKVPKPRGRGFRRRKLPGPKSRRPRKPQPPPPPPPPPEPRRKKRRLSPGQGGSNLASAASQFRVSNGPIHKWMIQNGWQRSFADNGLWLSPQDKFYIRESDNDGVVYTVDGDRIQQNRIQDLYVKNVDVSNNPQAVLPAYGVDLSQMSPDAFLTDEEWAVKFTGLPMPISVDRFGGFVYATDEFGNTIWPVGRDGTLLQPGDAMLEEQQPNQPSYHGNPFSPSRIAPVAPMYDPNHRASQAATAPWFDSNDSGRPGSNGPLPGSSSVRRQMGSKAPPPPQATQQQQRPPIGADNFLIDPAMLEGNNDSDIFGEYNNQFEFQFDDQDPFQDQAMDSNLPPQEEPAWNDQNGVLAPGNYDSTYQRRSTPGGGYFPQISPRQSPQRGDFGYTSPSRKITSERSVSMGDASGSGRQYSGPSSRSRSPRHKVSMRSNSRSPRQTSNAPSYTLRAEGDDLDSYLAQYLEENPHVGTFHTGDMPSPPRSQSQSTAGRHTPVPQSTLENASGDPNGMGDEAIEGTDTDLDINDLFEDDGDVEMGGIVPTRTGGGKRVYRSRRGKHSSFAFASSSSGSRRDSEIGRPLRTKYPGFSMTFTPKRCKAMKRPKYSSYRYGKPTNSSRVKSGPRYRTAKTPKASGKRY
ncbi:hypothetical protein EJ08DRAFT_702793 [Tothia fuscella]|uniref:Uncharacterized protein n=1 Tax=Tothia fuscella TaxID=1048955 RepID=A0A9P4NFP7_9PEZI|nr:hypothetical protein EJ08DRAFT_702793 [Tothia fuscella]